MVPNQQYLNPFHAGNTRRVISIIRWPSSVCPALSSKWRCRF